MWKALNLALVLEIILVIIFLVLIDQCMKISISKIMLSDLGFLLTPFKKSIANVSATYSLLLLKEKKLLLAIDGPIDKAV